MRPCVRLALATLLLCAAVRAEPAAQGRAFPAYSVKDAFDNPHTLAKETRFVVITSEKDVSGVVNDWLKAKGRDYLPGRKAEYVSDITPMPAVITRLFAKPKMKKYPFTILLADDPEFAKTYPAQKGKIAVFSLDDQQVVTAIAHVATAAEVEAILGK